MHLFMFPNKAILPRVCTVYFCIQARNSCPSFFPEIGIDLVRPICAFLALNITLRLDARKNTNITKS